MAGYVGDVAIAYDRDLGHVLFEQYASDIARRTAGKPVRDVLEVASGTGIVTRQLRNVLPGDAQLTAIDISDSMMEVARTKFLPHEQVTFQVANAVALPFDDRAFDDVADLRKGNGLLLELFADQRQRHAGGFADAEREVSGLPSHRHDDKPAFC